MNTDYHGAPLSGSERTAATHIANGCTRDEAAHRMGVALGTVVSILRRVHAKTDAVTSAQAVARLVARGILTPSSLYGPADCQPGPASEIIRGHLLTELDTDKLKGLNAAYRLLVEKGL